MPWRRLREGALAGWGGAGLGALTREGAAGQGAKGPRGRQVWALDSSGTECLPHPTPGPWQTSQDVGPSSRWRCPSQLHGASELGVGEVRGPASPRKGCAAAPHAASRPSTQPCAPSIQRATAHGRPPDSAPPLHPGAGLALRPQPAPATWTLSPPSLPPTSILPAMKEAHKGLALPASLEPFLGSSPPPLAPPNGLVF